MHYDAKFLRMQNVIGKMRSALVAFSAGVDSAFLAACAHKILGKRAAAVTVKSPFAPASESGNARVLAREIGIRHFELKYAPPATCLQNGPGRCYFCKKAMFSLLLREAKKRGFGCVIEGSNLDDLEDFRPGARALKELMVLSPLQQAGFTKKDIRGCARRMGLSAWNKESTPCLATRIPYGQAITPDKISAIDRAEAYLRSLFLSDVRVRHYGDTARIEVSAKHIPALIKKRQSVVDAFNALGFTYITVDLSGYRPGSMNEVLEWIKKRS